MTSRSQGSKLKRMRSNSITLVFPEGPAGQSSSSSRAETTPEVIRATKKQKLQTAFLVESPFPDFPHPTSAEALDVYNLLLKAHGGGRNLIRVPPVTSNISAESSSNVIEGLIDTILSQNTSAINSTRAKQSLDSTFGRNDFEAIANAPREDVIEAIRCGGLANKKAATIQNILHSIKERHGDYSLQHLGAVEKDKRMPDAEIMQELVSYDGVGPKTASCVLLFCLGRDSFAVDTHVFRLSKVLGWVPAKADRVLTQAHLDRRIPDKLKYGLHVLMVQHGRVCKGCKKSGSGQSCILRTYLKERKSKPDDLDQSISAAIVSL